MDWSLTNQYGDIRRFVRGLIDVRLELDMTRVMHGLSLREFLTRSLVEFHGVRLHQPDWSDDSHTLALTVWSVIGTRMVHAILNSYEHPLDFELPPIAKPTLSWRRVADTALDPPDDVADLQSAPPVRGATYRADAHSVVLLCADLHDATDAQHAPAVCARPPRIPSAPAAIGMDRSTVLPLHTASRTRRPRPRWTAFPSGEAERRGGALTL